MVSGLHTPDMCVQNVTHVGSPPLFQKKQVAVNLFPSDLLVWWSPVSHGRCHCTERNTATACEFFVGSRSLAEGRKLMCLISRGLIWPKWLINTLSYASLFLWNFIIFTLIPLSGYYCGKDISAGLRIPNYGCPQGLLGMFKGKRRLMPVFVLRAGNTQFKEYVASKMCNCISSFSVRG